VSSGLIDALNQYGLEPTVTVDGRLVVHTSRLGQAVIERREDVQWLAIDLGLAGRTPNRTGARPAKGGYLPAEPVRVWMNGNAWHEHFPQRSGDLEARTVARALRRIATLKQRTVSVLWAEDFVSRAGLQLWDLWPDMPTALDEGKQIRFRNQARGARAAAKRARPALPPPSKERAAQGQRAPA
jgi:hypothetical protein